MTAQTVPDVVVLEDLHAYVVRLAENHRTTRQDRRKKWRKKGIAPHAIEKANEDLARAHAWRRAIAVRHYALPLETQHLMADTLAATGRPAPQPLAGPPLDDKATS